MRIAWPESGRIIPPETTSIKVILVAWGGEGMSDRVAVKEATIPQGQTTTSFTNVPAGQFGIDAWGGVNFLCWWGRSRTGEGRETVDVAQAPSPVNRRRVRGAHTPDGGCATWACSHQRSGFTPAWGLNSGGVPIAQGWGWGWVRHGETTAVGVSMQEVGAGYSWFNGRVKWNGANTITWPWAYLNPSVPDTWAWTLGAENGEFYCGISYMQPTEQYHLWLSCSEFVDKDLDLLDYTAPDTVHQLGDIAVLPESRGVSPVPMTAEQWPERHRQMEQAREQR
jgi:hypothetical protein